MLSSTILTILITVVRLNRPSISCLESTYGFCYSKILTPMQHNTPCMRKMDTERERAVGFERENNMASNNNRPIDVVGVVVVATVDVIVIGFCSLCRFVCVCVAWACEWVSERMNASVWVPQYGPLYSCVVDLLFRQNKTVSRVIEWSQLWRVVAGVSLTTYFCGIISEYSALIINANWVRWY